MSRTFHLKHINRTAAEDRIRKFLLDAAERLGLGTELDADDCRRLAKLLGNLQEELKATSRRGGLVLVSQDDSLITAYRCNSFNPMHVSHDTAGFNLSSDERKFLCSVGLLVGGRPTMAPMPTRPHRSHRKPWSALSEPCSAFAA